MVVGFGGLVIYFFIIDCFWMGFLHWSLICVSVLIAAWLAWLSVLLYGLVVLVAKLLVAS